MRNNKVPCDRQLEMSLICYTKAEWIPVQEKPTLSAVYWVTMLTRHIENGDDVYGSMPPMDEYHQEAQRYAKLPDGRWVTMEMRYYDAEEDRWWGYCDRIIAYIPLPQPYTNSGNREVVELYASYDQRKSVGTIAQ